MPDLDSLQGQAIVLAGALLQASKDLRGSPGAFARLRRAHAHVVEAMDSIDAVQFQARKPIALLCGDCHAPLPCVCDETSETSETSERDDGLTCAEGVVMDALVEAVDAYGNLPKEHLDDPRDFCNAIHRCQDLLALRIARRHYPKGWKTLEGVEPTRRCGTCYRDRPSHGGSWGEDGDWYCAECSA